jgi:signal transduction histidine kinase
MLGEILLVLLVLVVAILMVVDLARTPGESPHGHAERPAYAPERATAAPFLPERATAAPFLGSGARTFSPEPPRAMPAAPAPVAGPPAREAEATRGFDQMHREMSRSAASEAEYRDKFNTIFVNLSHRSQSLVERQLRLIEDLEHGEQDAQRLTSLAKLNRIAMRMHRISQNLLVIAGQQVSPGWNQPVTLAHLIEAALAEVEDYQRISFEVQPDIAVRGPAVNDLVHLLVELMENATSFSAAEMPVHIKGRILTSGGALVDITDRGIGMSAEEMAHANQQLDNPPAVDTDVPKWMGLLVVARLAARHGVRVRLNQAELGGLTALVWFPDEILTHHSAAADPGQASAGPRGTAVGRTAFASARIVTPDMLAAPRPEPAWSARSPQATVPAEPPVAARLSSVGLTDGPGGDADVVVPHSETQARMQGLPIFDEVESRWSRGGREAPVPSGREPSVPPGREVPAPPGREVPAPPGLATAASPAAGAALPGGLPRRPPAGSAGPRGGPGPASGPPTRSGAAGRQGWAAPVEEAAPGGQDES